MRRFYWLHWLALAGWLGGLAWAGPVPAAKLEYSAQAGDALEAVALRFGVPVKEIESSSPLPYQGLINPGQVLLIPMQAAGRGETRRLLPDSEFVYGPSAAGFDVSAYLRSKGGFLATYREYMGSTAWTSAADALQRVAIENSVNPRLLLALLEWECHCVLGSGSQAGQAQVQTGYALGVEDFHHQWLYRQLGWAANQLSVGYYGWRNGSLFQARLPNGIQIEAGPASNAGSVALEYYFARLAVQKAMQRLPTSQQGNVKLAALGNDWKQALDPQTGFVALYRRMFGDVWAQDAAYGPLFPAGVQQPVLQLPFEASREWSFTVGPHKAWETEGALAALDFAPASADTGCLPTDAWIAAVAAGRVVRSEFGIVIEDLAEAGGQSDGGYSDGWEQTGWAILYMHVATQGRVPVGTSLQAGDRIGQPSCEGGPATGTHVHIARKYNGEWVDAGGALPFVLSGWTAQAGQEPLSGTLTQLGRVVTARVYGNYETKISLILPPPPYRLPPHHAQDGAGWVP